MPTDKEYKFMLVLICFQGEVCAEMCPRLKYGQNCQSICQCYNGASCNHVDGTCRCEPGFYGDKCENRCDPGKYGYLCLLTCSCHNGGTCSHVDGSCSCTPGWTPESNCEDSGKCCNNLAPSPEIFKATFLFTRYVPYAVLTI